MHATRIQAVKRYLRGSLCFSGHRNRSLSQPSLMRIGLVVKIVGDPSLGIVFILEHILYPGLPRSSLLSPARVQRLNTGLFSLVILAASLSIHGYIFYQYWTLTACWILIILSIPLLDVGCTSQVFGCTAYIHIPRQLIQRCSPPHTVTVTQKRMLTPTTGAQTCKHVSERTNTLTLMTAELFRYLAGAATEITSSKYLIPVSLLILVLCQRFDPKSAWNLRLWAATD